MLLQRSVAEILANIRLLGRIAGVPSAARQVAARFAGAARRGRARVAGRKPPSAIMITGRLGNGLLLVAREGTYTGDAMVLAGGALRLAGTATLAQVSPEAILNADPDVLLWAGNERDLEGADRAARLVGHARGADRAAPTREPGRASDSRAAHDRRHRASRGDLPSATAMTR